MTDTAGSASCSIPGCRREPASAPALPEPLCDHHLAMAKPAHRERLASTARRAAWLESIWEDSGRFEELVAQDRYIQLTNATSMAQELFEAAFARCKLSILAAEGTGSAPAVEQQGRSATG